MKLIAAIFLFSFAGATYACPPGMPCGALSTTDVMKEADINKDGFVSRDEYDLKIITGNNDKVFDCADGNGDEKLDVFEYTKTIKCSQNIEIQQNLDGLIDNTKELN